VLTGLSYVLKVLLLIVITLSGIALGLNNLWTLIFLIPAIILCHFALMVPGIDI